MIDLPGTTLTPGLVEGHSHILLHAYSEASWETQVSKEGLALRVARAVNHLRDTLNAGFTTVRDLGTEGAGYADVELRDAVRQGIVPGPRVLASTRAIVATGSYQPRFVPEWNVPQGAEEADGVDSLTRVIRDQIGRGADWIKLYGDYRWGPLPGSHPTFTLDEMKRAVEVAESAGVPVAVHTSTPEGMRRAAMANVATIEHGNEGTPEVFKLMVEHHVALVPDADGGRRTVAAGQSELAGEPAQEGGLQGGARCRRDDHQRQRRRHLPARRGSARARSDGRLRHDAGRRGQERDVDRREGAADGESDRPGEGGPLRRSGRVRRRSDEGHRRAAPREVRDEERGRLQAA